MFIILIFTAFFLLVFWTFVLYPAVIWIVSSLFPKQYAKGAFSGKVSMIVAAHNEEEVIREKVENCLSLDLGSADWEIIIVSDGSIDSTETILSEYKNISERLHIITYQPRAGKSNALNVGFSVSKGEILIFSDANVMLEPDAPMKLLMPFADPQIGAVCGKVHVKGRGNDEIAGESLYMKLEGIIQKAEGEVWSMVGTDGALFALRRELFRNIEKETILDDFALSMEAPLNDKRIVYAQEAQAVEEVIASVANEFKRKTRIISGGYQYLVYLLNARQDMQARTLFLFSFISHKVLRWLAPFFMIGMFVASLFLLKRFFYRFMFMAQSIFYICALMAHYFPRLRTKYAFYIPYYFCMVNYAALLGFLRFFSSSQGVLWDKVSR